MGRVEQLSDTSVIDVRNLKTKKDGRDRKVYGNFSFNVPIDDSYTIQVELFTKQGGEYRKTPFKMFEIGYCTLTENDTFFYKELSEVSDLVFPAPCPFAKVAIGS